MQLCALVRQVARCYPELRIETAALNEEGQYNSVLIVNNSLVFRFAKVRPAVKTLRTEVAVQRWLHGRLPLCIPNPIYHCLDTDAVGEAFAGYQLIAGRPLWREAFAEITDDRALTRIARELGEFLRALHATPPNTIPVALPRYETPEHWSRMYSRIRNDLFPYMRDDARRQVSDHFEGYLDAAGDDAMFEPRLRHGDFGTGNIIYDPPRLTVVGIIDFGHVGVGDPACDFAGLLSSYGESFYARAAEVYPEMGTSMQRVQFIRGTFALEEALFGFANSDRKAFEAGMAQYA